MAVLHSRRPQASSNNKLSSASVSVVFLLFALLPQFSRALLFPSSISASSECKKHLALSTYTLLSWFKKSMLLIDLLQLQDICAFLPKRWTPKKVTTTGLAQKVHVVLEQFVSILFLDMHLLWLINFTSSRFHSNMSCNVIIILQ